jgi:dihydrofolate reductase
MRRLILKMSVSLDGFVGGPNGEIDWIFKTMDGGATAWTVDTLWAAGAHLMGSRTYYDMASWWPQSTEAFAAPMNEIPKVVFTRQGRVEPARMELTTTAQRDATRNSSTTALSEPVHLASWIDPKICSGDLREDVARLKSQPGRDILAHGGARFAQSLVRENLVDEYRLLVHPVVLGNGLPLFAGLRKPLDLKLHSTVWFASGTLAQVYERAS